MAPTWAVPGLFSTDFTKGPVFTEFLSLPTLLESNLWCFQRAPSLGAIVLRAFFVTRHTTLLLFFFGFVKLVFHIFLLFVKIFC